MRKPYLAIANWVPGVFNTVGWVVTFWWRDGSRRDVSIGTGIAEGWIMKGFVVNEALRRTGLVLLDESELNTVQLLERQEGIKL